MFELPILCDRVLLLKIDMVIEKVLVKVARSSFEGVLIREWETDNNVCEWLKRNVFESDSCPLVEDDKL